MGHSAAAAAVARYRARTINGNCGGTSCTVRPRPGVQQKKCGVLCENFSSHCKDQHAKIREFLPFAFPLFGP